MTHPFKHAVILSFSNSKHTIKCVMYFVHIIIIILWIFMLSCGTYVDIIILYILYIYMDVCIRIHTNYMHAI